MTIQEMANDIRNIFNEYFIQNTINPSKYNMTFNYCNFFEELYRGFESRSFMKETRNVMELKKKINLLRKEIKEKTHPSGNNLNISINDNLTSFISKKVKYTLSNNIKSLNAVQMKGVVNILQDYINIESDRIFEFDIDKVPPHKIKELNKYVIRCLKEKKIPVKLESFKEEMNTASSVEPHLIAISDSDSVSSDDESVDV
jgi:hypothetical protein